jgi:hypothetical protein
MTILPILPLIAGATLLCAPLSYSSNPETAHPHYPMVTKLAGVKGNVSISWFTVPHNAEQVKTAGPNYIWSRGFTLKTDVALKCGNVSIPAGSYAFGFQLDEKGKKWSALLQSPKLRGLSRQLARARRSGAETPKIEAELKEAAKKNVLLPTENFKGKHAEHLRLYVINYGYKTGGRRNPDPISGVDAEFRISFGDLHIKFAVSEVLEAKKGDSPNRRRRR